MKHFSRCAVAAVATIAALAVGPASASAGVACGGANLVDPAGFTWDVDTRGVVVQGTIDEYDGYGFARFTRDGTGITVTYPTASACPAEDNGRELSYPAQPVNGIVMSRKFYVPSTGQAFARWIDVLSNPSGDTVSGVYEFKGDLGSDGGTTTIVTSDENTTLQPGDSFSVTDDGDPSGGDNPLAHVFDSVEQVADRADAYSTFENSYGASYNVSLAPGETKTFMHIEAQRSTRDQAVFDVSGLAVGFGDRYTGLSPAEISSLQNWPKAPPADPPDASVSDAGKVTEGKKAKFVITLAEASDETVTLSYLTQDGTAKATKDYEAANGTVEFAPGETKKVVKIKTVENRKREKGEKFTLSIGSVTVVDIIDGSGTATIKDDDKK